MTRIIRLRDPVLEAIHYLAHWFPNVQPEVPPGWTWDRELITVQDAGGSGEYDVILDDVMLRLMVAAASQEAASLTARTVHGLLRRWGEDHAGVSFRDTIQRPTYDPDPDTGAPAYTMTVRLVLHAEDATVTP